MSTISMKFDATDPRVGTVVGERVGGVIRLRSEAGFGLFGPYVELPSGSCVGRIFFDGPAQGQASIDILAEGSLILASRVVDLSSLNGRPAEISANLASSHMSCELRLLCGPGVHADISSVEIELGQYTDAIVHTDARANLEENFKFLITTMLLRPPNEGEVEGYLLKAQGNPSEAVSIICSQPEFVMKHPSFTPKAMAESLVAADVNGVEVLVPSNDWVHWGTAQGWGYETWVAGAMRRILKPGSVFVDIGANTGVLTMLGASLVGNEGQVYAVEASIENASIILANIRHAKLGNTVILPIAVTNKKGIEFISVDYGGSNKLVRTESVDSQNFQFEPIATDTLDSLFSHIPRVDLIKIDIEGREGSALRGARDLIARTRPQIIGEYHFTSPEPWYADELVAQGYHMTVLTREGGVEELEQDLDKLRLAASDQLSQHGSCLEILFTPAP